MPKYGKIIKQICFDSTDQLHANLKIRLHYDDIRIKHFFNEVIEAYLNKNEHIMGFIEDLKEKRGISKSKRNKINRSNAREKQIKESFNLEDSEIENIFDIIEKEWDI